MEEYIDKFSTQDWKIVFLSEEQELDDFDDEESSNEEIDQDEIDELTKELSELNLGASDDGTSVPND